METENREGIIFFGRVERTIERWIHVFLFLTLANHHEPIFIGGAGFAPNELLSDAQLVDKALYGYLITWGGDKRFTDPQFISSLNLTAEGQVELLAIREILEIAQNERLNKVVWFKRRYRFLRSQASDISGSSDVHFILTEDKSDLPEKEKLILELGEKEARKKLGRCKKFKAEESIRKRKERDRYILEELPKDPRLQELFRKAVEGKASVSLEVKGFRPMWRPMAEYSWNCFHIKSSKDKWSDIPVATICRMASVDPQLLQMAYFNLKGFLPERRYAIERRDWTDLSIVTNLLPFPKIQWRRYSGSAGYSYSIGTIWRSDPYITEKQIREIAKTNILVERLKQKHRQKKRKIEKKRAKPR